MAVDLFLKIPDIPGESQDETHKDEIEVLSWSWGQSQVGSMAIGGGGGAGKVNMQDFNFTMYTSKASCKLMKACATGDHIPTATMTARKPGGEPYDYLIFTFTDLLITSYNTGGSGEIPVENITFNFAAIDVKYNLQDAAGKVANAGSFGYNLKTNKAAA